MRNEKSSYDEKWLGESEAKQLKQINDEKKASLIMSRMEKDLKEKQYYLVYISYDKLWSSEFYNNVSAKISLQDTNPNQLKLKVNDFYKKDEKIITKFEPMMTQT